MIPQRFRTAVTSFGLTLALMAGLLASPAGTLAAVANVAVGGGVVPGTPANAATPTAVSPGKIAAFYVWAKNNDSANLSSFFLTAESTATPIGAYWWHSADPDQIFACDTQGGLRCDFGAFPSGEDVVVLTAFQLPNNASDSLANCDPANPPTADTFVCAHFMWGAESGYVLDRGKNKSRGDAYDYFAVVRTDLGNDAAAQFPWCDPFDPDPCDADLLSLNNGTTVNKNNVQVTAVTAPPGAFNSAHGTTGIAVRDNFPFSCPTGTTLCAGHATAGDFVGQWSEVGVNSEATFDEWIRTQITMYGVNANQVDGVLHLWTIDGVTWYQEEITERCASADGPSYPPLPDDPSTNADNGCFLASNSPGNTAELVVYHRNNGNMRGY